MLLAPSLKKNVQGPSVTLQSLGRRSSIKWSRNNPVKSPGQPVFPLWMLILRVGRTPFSRAARTAGGDRAAERSWLRGTPASQAHSKKKREFGWARHVSQVCTDTQSMSAAEAGRPSERIGKGDWERRSGFSRSYSPSAFSLLCRRLRGEGKTRQSNRFPRACFQTPFRGRRASRCNGQEDGARDALIIPAQKSGNDATDGRAKQRDGTMSKESRGKGKRDGVCSFAQVNEECASCRKMLARVGRTSDL